MSKEIKKNLRIENPRNYTCIYGDTNRISKILEKKGWIKDSLNRCWIKETLDCNKYGILKLKKRLEKEKEQNYIFCKYDRRIKSVKSVLVTKDNNKRYKLVRKLDIGFVKPEESMISKHMKTVLCNIKVIRRKKADILKGIYSTT